MYNIYLYYTDTGGGIAFIDSLVPKKLGTCGILSAISHQRDIAGCYYIGTTNDIDLSKLLTVDSYTTPLGIPHESCPYIDVELGFNIYYYGGDCC